MRLISLALPVVATVAFLALPTSAPAAALPFEPTAVEAQGRALRPLPASEGGFMMSGEQSRAAFPVFLSKAEAAAGVDLVLALESAVSVMPEASRLAVFVGKTEVGALPLGGGKATRTLTFAPGALSAGWNRIRLVATQRHRVDCSLQGAYELWTKIDNAASGIAVAASVPAEAPALQRATLDATGALVVRIRTVNREAATVSAAFALAGQGARAAGATAARVEFPANPGLGAATAAAARSGHGIDLFYGSAAELKTLGVAQAVILAAAGGPQLATSAGALALVVAKGKATADLTVIRSGDPRSADGRAKQVGLDDVTVSLGALGMTSSRFTGRDFRETIELSLPGDALIADYGSVVLRLDAAYAAELSEGNGLNISVNGILAATLPLGRRAGEVFERRPIELPLSAFRPGANRIEIEAIVRSAADDACTAPTQISGAPRFLLLDTSTLQVPRLARMASLPELSATFGAADAIPARSKAQRLLLAAFDADTLAAAGTFVARQSILAPEMPRFEVASLPVTDRGGAIVFGKASDLGEPVAALAGIDRAAFEALRDRPAEIAALDDASATPGIDPTTTGSIALPAAEGMSNAADLLAEWQRGLTVGGSADSIIGTLGSAVSGLSGAFATRPAAVPLPVDARTTLLVAQSLPTGWTAPLTVVTAATDADLHAGMLQLALPGLAADIEGRAIVVSGSHVLSVKADTLGLIATTAPSFSNLRLVAAAWLSLNPALHAALLLAATLLFGGITALWLRRGRREEQPHASA